MKKILFLFALIPFMLNAQTPYGVVDLSKYHDANRLWEMADVNFALKASLASPDFTGSASFTSTSATGYHDMINSEWTPTTDIPAGGANGIYSIINPIFDVSNAYGLRSRVDMRDATGAVAVNQLHAVDGLMNFSDQAYSAVDNISVFGAAAHAVDITAGDITGGTHSSLNLYYGVWGPSVLKNFTLPTNGMLIVTHAGTYLDYGYQIQNSGYSTAGLYIKNHASNVPASMTSGILMESKASAMTYGVNMTGAGITGADILLQEGETIDNINNGTVTVTGNLSVQGAFNYGADAQANDDYEVAIDGLTALVKGMVVIFEANTANTGACTLEITSIGDLDAIKKLHDQDPGDNDIEDGSMVMVVFDGTNWQMMNPEAN